MLATGVGMLAGWPVAVLAAGLGPVVEQSSLGQSLRVVIPVVLGPGEEIPGECFRLVAADRDADGIPQAMFGRVTFERTGDGARIVVTNPRPVQEPVLRLTVRIGCDTAVRREYTLLLDPPVIDVPVAAADADAPTRMPVTAVAPRERRPAVEGRAVKTGPRGVAEGAPETRKAAKGKKGVAAKAPSSRRPPPARASDSPRLTVSRAAPGVTPDVAARQGPTLAEIQAQQDLANALEAETVALRQRVAELTAMVDRMQEQVRVQQSADAAARAAREPVRDPPVPVASRWWEENWPLVAMIVGLPLLIAAGLLWRRRNSVPVETGRIGTMTSNATQSMPKVVTQPQAPRAVTKPAPPKPDVRHAPAGGANELAVSELSQITEEARVYVALGHPDRAMSVLREHLQQAPRAMPAAWMMLLDLYHTHGRRQEFRELAQQFHQHCNVEAPTWESYATRERDATGLVDYPHVVKRIVGLWRLPECRDYLERLLLDNREGKRNGFSLMAYGEILTLLQVLDAPAVDIDSDLAEEGKLRSAFKAAARDAKLGDVPGSTNTSPAPARAVAPARPTAPPAQGTIAFDLDADLSPPKGPQRR